MIAVNISVLWQSENSLSGGVAGPSDRNNFFLAILWKRFWFIGAKALQ
jgi:hypothetical protein